MAAGAVATKTCSKCEKDKSIDDFYRRSKSRDGRQPYCKVCSQAAAREHEKINPQMRRDQERRWRRGKPRSAQAKDRHSNFRKRSRERQGCDQEAIDYFNIIIHDLCSYCGFPSEHVDHIEPVASGGSNSWDNFTGACSSCNSRKKAEPLLSFLLRPSDPLDDLPF